MPYIGKYKSGWRAVLSNGSDPQTGKPKRHYFYGKSKGEVQEKLNAAISELHESGRVFQPSKLYFMEWLDKWLLERIKNTVRATTLENYQRIIKNHIAPVLGAIRLRDLTPSILLDFYNKKHNEGLSQNSLKLIRSVILGSLKQAQVEGLLKNNPAMGLKLPKGQEPVEKQVLDSGNIERIMPILREDRLGAAFLLALGSGLRRGELLGLKWENVDLEKGNIKVEVNLVRVNGELTLQEPKTKQSKRVIPLPSTIIAELKAHRKRQLEERLAAGGKYEENGLVFPNTKGGFIDPQNFHRTFKRICDKVGLNNISIHSLRHSYATLLMEAGENPKTVMELLGHSDISTTLGIYSHASEGMKERAVGKLEGIF